MRRNIIFLISAASFGILLATGVFLYHFMYPQNYQKNAAGEYINVSVPTPATFPITKDTRFQIEYHYPLEGRMFIENLNTIPELLGCDKDGVNAYLKKYMEHLSYEERQDGLVSYDLISYKNQLITLRKTFREPQYNGYIAKSFNGTIVILNGDGRTVYEYTDIDVSTLPDDIQEQMQTGYTLENESDLYNFLETYSS